MLFYSYHCGIFRQQQLLYIYNHICCKLTETFSSVGEPSYDIVYVWTHFTWLVYLWTYFIWH